MPVYKLKYFDVMGLGEVIRFLLSYGGHEFEDIRVDREKWPDMKASTPYGQLPILEIDGQVCCQTLPLCRYLAKQMDLIGQTDLDALNIDMVASAIYDLRKHVAIFYRESDPELKAKKKHDTVKNIVPFYLNKLENIAEQNGQYFHKETLSYADLLFVSVYDSMANACEMDIIANHTNLKALRNNVLQIPSIKAWIEKRPKLNF